MLRRQRVVQGSRARELEAAHAAGSRGGPRAASCARRQALGSRIGETGVCGAFSGFVVARGPDSAFAGKNRLYLAQPSEVWALEKQGLTGDVWVRDARGLHWLTPFAEEPASPPGKQARSRPERGAAEPGGNFGQAVHLPPTRNWPRFEDRRFRYCRSRVTVIFQRPGFPGSRGRRAAENSSLLHNRQLSKLSARPAAPPWRRA